MSGEIPGVVGLSGFRSPLSELVIAGLRPAPQSFGHRSGDSLGCRTQSAGKV